MNCPNCGRALAEGEVCNCVQPNSEPAPQTGAYYTPNTEQQATPYATPVYENTPPAGAYYQPAAQPPMYSTQAIAIPARTDYPEGYRIKKKYVAVLLAAILGPVGVHNFYLGNSSKGLAQLLIATIGSLVVVGPIVSAVWAYVEAVMLLTEKIDRDADGYKIQTFEEAIAKELNKNKNNE